jgi:hypothetical protein
LFAFKSSKICRKKTLKEKAFLELLEKDADKREILHQLTAQRLKSTDEYETLIYLAKRINKKLFL